MRVIELFRKMGLPKKESLSPIQERYPSSSILLYQSKLKRQGNGGLIKRGELQTEREESCIVRRVFTGLRKDQSLRITLRNNMKLQ
jgi:hypothetical protein